MEYESPSRCLGGEMVDTRDSKSRAKYIQPTPILLPINILEDFTKPLSLSFRLFRNILAGELVVLVLVSLVPSVVPIPIMLLGLYRRIHGGSLLTSFQNSLFFFI